MEIRNNLLVEIKQSYLSGLIKYYPVKEAEQLLTILIDHFFGIGRYDMVLKPNIRLSESEILKLHIAVKDLKKNIPVQYIIGEVEFMDLKFLVNNNVLIPRSETEELVQLMVDRENKTGLSILDIGTGSGCIAICLDKKLDEPRVFATDISQSALGIARKNAMLNNADVSFFNHDIFDDKGLGIGNLKFDIVVSNPPYVTLEDKQKMHPNVLNYEPHKALFVPEDEPLIYYNAILRFADRTLKSGGRVYAEINESLGNEMVLLFEKYKYNKISLVDDINGKTRFIHALKNY